MVFSYPKTIVFDFYVQQMSKFKDAFENEQSRKVKQTVKQRDYASSFKYVLREHLKHRVERSQTNANNVTLKTPIQGI